MSVVFVGIEHSDAVRAYAIKKLDAIASGNQDLELCRLVLEANHHSHLGHRYRAKLELNIDRTALVVGSQGEPFIDLYAAIDSAVSDAKRVLHQRSARRQDRRHA